MQLVSEGVHQGCILSPFLLNFYINDVVTFIHSYHIPKILNREVNILLYANDIILLSTTQVGMRRILKHFDIYYQENNLCINNNKSNANVFGKKEEKLTNGLYILKSYSRLNVTAIWTLTLRQQDLGHCI